MPRFRDTAWVVASTWRWPAVIGFALQTQFSDTAALPWVCSQAGEELSGCRDSSEEREPCKCSLPRRNLMQPEHCRSGWSMRLPTIQWPKPRIKSPATVDTASDQDSAAIAFARLQPRGIP